MAAEARAVYEILEQASTSHDVAPGPALAALLRHHGPVLVDLDETLYLRNSTEDFIDSARPALLALLVLRLLDSFRPWRWTGGTATRDVWRVRTIMLLFPWVGGIWARRAAKLGASQVNGALLAVLKERASSGAEPAIIATVGFQRIVAPLIAALGVPADTRIIAARHTVFADRAAGKLNLVLDAVGQATLSRSLVLTDSMQDAPLLDACAVPLHTVWPLARFQPAFSRVYLPGQYLSQIKRPGERYITRGIVQEDFALWVLASLTLPHTLAQPLLHITGLLFLLLSFWAVYESGYVDNDGIAERYEREPTLSAEYRTITVGTSLWAPWVWALISGAIGCAVLRGPDLRGAYAFSGWVAVLLATYSTFLIYNRLNKSTRIWWYAALQVARSAAFVVVVPVSLIGAVAVAAHIVAKWVPYYIYRLAGKAWPAVSHFMPRLLFFLLLTVTLSFAVGYTLFWNWSAAALLAWNVYRARGQLFGARRIEGRIGESRDRTFREEKVVGPPAAAPADGVPV